MKYVTTSEKVKELDRRAVEDWGIPASVLMENAGRSAAELIEEELPSGTSRVLVIAGKGNNGGDGLVVARRLLDRGYQVEAFVLGDRGELSTETGRNAKILERMTERVRYCSPDYEGLIREVESNPSVIVDAIFGIGVEGELRGSYPELVARINDSEAKKIAIDLPSGIPANTGAPPGKAVKVDLTITMGLYKQGTLRPEARDYVGRQEVVSVGYPKKLVGGVPGLWPGLNDELARHLLPDRSSGGHKGDFGRLLVAGGSDGMTGAPLLAAEAGLRSGAGLVYLAGPASLNDVFAFRLREALSVPVSDREGAFCPESLDDLLQAAEGKDALALGPGIGRREGTGQAVRSLLERTSRPVVLDADGIVSFSDNREELKDLNKAVLTPHPGELAHLLGLDPQEVDRNRYELVPDLAEDWGLTLLLKGVPTVIASPAGDLALANCPNSGMAKGGSGDVLTGLIGSFLAQGLPPFTAARLGAWLHCRAGGLGAEEHGVDSLQPGDTIKELGAVLSEWRGHKGSSS